MKIVTRTLILFLLSLCFSTPLWATGNGNDNDHFDKLKTRLHAMIVDHQVRALKNLYSKSDTDARLLFLNDLGALPSTQEHIPSLREEYEGQIAHLKAALTSSQQQLEALTAEMNAACETHLALAMQTFQSAAEQHVYSLVAAHQEELEGLEARMNVACDTRLAQAEVAWQASAAQPCPHSDLLRSAGAIGTGDIAPYAAEMDGEGNIFVLDYDNRTISKFNPAGDRTAQWSPAGLRSPVDIALDANGNIYVVDQSQDAAALQKFSPNGDPQPMTLSTQIQSPTGLFIDSQGKIYITSKGGKYGGLIRIFDISGQLIATFGEEAELMYQEYNDIVVDEERQTIYVLTDTMVAKFTMSGSYIDSWEGDFAIPYGIAVAANGNIIVSDTGNDMVDVYDAAGHFIYSFANDVDLPLRAFTDRSGKLYVTDYHNSQIRIYE